MSAGSSSQSQNLQNVYYKRPVGTARPCSMCNRETRTVLWNPLDFLYTCDTHLTDPGFATLVSTEPEPAPKKEISQDEINKVKEEWEARQKKKREAAEAAAKEKEKAEESKDSKDNKTTDTSNNPSGSSTPATTNRKSPAQMFSSPNSAPTHQQYTLHRQIFAMRQNALRKKRNASQAKEVAPLLPRAPRAGLE